MVTKICACCGKPFEAKRETARYCSKQCANRYRYMGHKAFGKNPPDISIRESFDDVANALADARRVSNTLARLAHTAPRQLRAGCQRIADAIAIAIKNEEW